MLVVPQWWTYISDILEAMEQNHRNMKKQPEKQSSRVSGHPLGSFTCKRIGRPRADGMPADNGIHFLVQ